jgi:hypothetical protein
MKMSRRFLWEFALAMLVLVMLAATAPAQSVHQGNAQTVSRAYWAFLGRQPDASGQAFWTYEMDRGAKDKASIDDAFLASLEYQSAASHPTGCVADYTKVGDIYAQSRAYLKAIAEKPQELVTVSGEYLSRDLYGTELDPGNGFLGNALTFQSGGCKYTVWYDWTKPSIHESLALLSELSYSETVEVTYDPVSGLATAIRITAKKVVR